MGWAIDAACGPNESQRATTTNYLEIFVSSSNSKAMNQISQFIQYIEQNMKGLNKNVQFANIDNIRIRYYDNFGRMKEIYKGNDLNEDKYGNIISQINNE